MTSLSDIIQLANMVYGVVITVKSNNANCKILKQRMHFIVNKLPEFEQIHDQPLDYARLEDLKDLLEQIKKFLEEFSSEIANDTENVKNKIARKIREGKKSVRRIIFSQKNKTIFSHLIQALNGISDDLQISMTVNTKKDTRVILQHFEMGISQYHHPQFNQIDYSLGFSFSSAADILHQISILSRPGIDKTTLIQYISHQWSQGNGTKLVKKITLGLGSVKNKLLKAAEEVTEEIIKNSDNDRLSNELPQTHPTPTPTSLSESSSINLMPLFIGAKDCIISGDKDQLLALFGFGNEEDLNTEVFLRESLQKLASQEVIVENARFLINDIVKALIGLHPSIEIQETLLTRMDYVNFAVVVPRTRRHQMKLHSDTLRRCEYLINHLSKNNSDWNEWKSKNDYLRIVNEQSDGYKEVTLLRVECSMKNTCFFVPSETTSNKTIEQNRFSIGQLQALFVEQIVTKKINSALQFFEYLYRKHCMLLELLKDVYFRRAIQIGKIQQKNVCFLKLVFELLGEMNNCEDSLKRMENTFPMRLLSQFLISYLQTQSGIITTSIKRQKVDQIRERLAPLLCEKSDFVFYQFRSQIRCGFEKEPTGYAYGLGIALNNIGLLKMQYGKRYTETQQREDTAIVINTFSSDYSSYSGIDATNLENFLSLFQEQLIEFIIIWATSQEKHSPFSMLKHFLTERTCLILRLLREIMPIETLSHKKSNLFEQFFMDTANLENEENLQAVLKIWGSPLRDFAEKICASPERKIITILCPKSADAGLAILACFYYAALTKSNLTPNVEPFSRFVNSIWGSYQRPINLFTDKTRSYFYESAEKISVTSFRDYSGKTLLDHAKEAEHLNSSEKTDCVVKIISKLETIHSLSQQEMQDIEVRSESLISHFENLPAEVELAKRISELCSRYPLRDDGTSSVGYELKNKIRQFGVVTVSFDRLEEAYELEKELFAYQLGLSENSVTDIIGKHRQKAKNPNASTLWMSIQSCQQQFQREERRLQVERDRVQKLEKEVEELKSIIKQRDMKIKNLESGRQTHEQSTKPKQHIEEQEEKLQAELEKREDSLLDTALKRRVSAGRPSAESKFIAKGSSVVTNSSAMFYAAESKSSSESEISDSDNKYSEYDDDNSDHDNDSNYITQPKGAI